MGIGQIFSGLGIKDLVSSVAGIFSSFKAVISMVDVIFKMFMLMLSPIADVIMSLLYPILIIMKPIVLFVKQFMKPFFEAMILANRDAGIALKEGNVAEAIKLQAAGVASIVLGFSSLINGITFTIIDEVMTLVIDVFRLVAGEDTIFSKALDKLEDAKDAIGVGVAEGITGVYNAIAESTGSSAIVQKGVDIAANIGELMISNEEMRETFVEEQKSIIEKTSLEILNGTVKMVDKVIQGNQKVKDAGIKSAINMQNIAKEEWNRILIAQAENETYTPGLFITAV